MMRMPAAKPRTLGAGGRNAATSIPKEDHIRSVGMYPCSLAYAGTMAISMSDLDRLHLRQEFYDSWLRSTRFSGRGSEEA